MYLAVGVLMVYGCWDAGEDGYRLPTKLLAMGPLLIVLGLAALVIPTHRLYRIQPDQGGFGSWMYVRYEKKPLFWMVMFVAAAVGIGHLRYFLSHGYELSR